MRLCDVHGCGDTYPSVGELTAHRILDHDSLPSTALVQARLAFGLATLAPIRMTFVVVPVRAESLEIARPVRRSRATRGPVSVAPSEVAQPAPNNPPRRLHRSKSHQADPASCVYCARFAPEKCGRHGGPSHSTSFTGDRTDQAAYVAWRDKIRPLWKRRQQAIRTQKRAAGVLV